MAKDDATPHALVGRAGLVFAYVCFAIAIGTIAGAIYLLPLDLKAKLFLAAAALLLSSMFVFLAIVAHLVLRLRGADARGPVAPSGRKEGRCVVPPDADGSHWPR